MQNLEERTLAFAIRVRKFVRGLPKITANYEDGKQVIRSSGSVGANYIEANEKLGPKDLGYRMKIARKEAKETVYWLKVISGSNEFEKDKHKENDHLIDEAEQLQRILSAIINKLQ